jgi:hypothetical protein
MKVKFLAGLICLITFSLSAMAQAREAEKFVEFGSITCEEYLARMDVAMTQVDNNPNLKAFVFVYEGKTQRYKYKKDESHTIVSVFPQYGLANAKIRSMKKYLSIRGFPSERFMFVKAGFRENFTVEIWFVPDGVREPEPSPTLTKVKYRKGKPEGFCLNCCES